MRFIPFLFLLFIASCQFNAKTDDSNTNTVFVSNYQTVIENAKGFEISEADSFLTLRINSLSQNYPFSDSLVFVKYPAQIKAKLWHNNWERMACQSTTHLIFLNALGHFNDVIALSDIEYMPKDSMYGRIEKSGIAEINKNNSVDIEKLVSLETNIFFMYPFEWESKKYKQANLKTLLIAEYLEQTVVARLEWIKVFGLIVGKEKLADSIFNSTKSLYEGLRKVKSNNKTVFFNLPFKELWDMPAPNSITANLIKDAGFNYLFDNQSESIDNISMSKEMVWAEAHTADYWIIIASRPKDFTLDDLSSEEEVYKTFKAVQKKQVIFCNTNESSYFTQGILEPHIMLKDLLFLTNEIQDHEPKYFHLLK